MSTSKGSWGELYHHVVRAHMSRAPSGTFHSHNFSAVMSCLLRDTSKQSVRLACHLVLIHVVSVNECMWSGFFFLNFIFATYLHLLLSWCRSFLFLPTYLIHYLSFHGTEWPIMCWCAVKKLLTHCRSLPPLTNNDIIGDKRQEKNIKCCVLLCMLQFCTNIWSSLS